MQLTKYIDFKQIFEDCWRSHLEQYPTAESFKKEAEDFEIDHKFIDELYSRLELYKNDKKYYNLFEIDYEEQCDGYTCNEVLKGVISLELTQGNEWSNEGGSGYDGFGDEFLINLEFGIFVGYKYNNYST